MDNMPDEMKAQLARMLQQLLSMEASPEDLEKMQNFLDGFFSMIPDRR